jgi:hypothetical protein
MRRAGPSSFPTDGRLGLLTPALPRPVMKDPTTV